MKKLLNLFAIVFLSFSLSLYAQNTDESQTGQSPTDQTETDQTTTDQSQTDSYDQNTDAQTGNQDQNIDPQATNGINQSSSIQSQTLEQLDAELAKLSEEPSDDIEMNLESIAEKHARHLQTQFSLDEDGYEDMKECLTDYLTDAWETRIALAKERNDFEAVQEYDADLAYMRVDLVESIKDEIPEEQVNMWSNEAVNFWLTLDTDFHAAKQQSVGFATIAPIDFDSNIQTGEGSSGESTETNIDEDLEN